MARDRANIRIDMWADADWRKLAGDAQRLYMQLLSHPKLSYAGVTDWHPGRLAKFTGDQTAESIELAGVELEDRFFIVIDRETDEVLVRSFVKHDGLMKQPRMVVSMTNAYAAITSMKLQQVIAFEVQKLRDREPDLAAWRVKQTETILKAQAVDVHTLTPSASPLFTPDVTHSVTPSQAIGQGLHTSTTTSTATKERAPANRGSRLPDDWTISESLTAWASENAQHVDLAFESEKFRNYWIAKPGKDGVKLNWDATWKNWILRVRDDYAKNAPSVSPRLRIRAGQVVS